jgi:hypothetical protein
LAIYAISFRELPVPAVARDVSLTVSRISAMRSVDLTKFLPYRPHSQEVRTTRGDGERAICTEVDDGIRRN